MQGSLERTRTDVGIAGAKFMRAMRHLMIHRSDIGAAVNPGDFVFGGAAYGNGDQVKARHRSHGGIESLGPLRMSGSGLMLARDGIRG